MMETNSEWSNPHDRTIQKVRVWCLFVLTASIRSWVLMIWVWQCPYRMALRPGAGCVRSSEPIWSFWYNCSNSGSIWSWASVWDSDARKSVYFRWSYSLHAPFCYNDHYTLDICSFSLFRVEKLLALPGAHNQVCVFCVSWVVHKLLCDLC